MDDEVYSMDDLTFQRYWSSKASETAALDRVKKLVEDKASSAYIAGKDEIASELRECAKEINKLYMKSSEALDKFILFIRQ